MPPVDIPQISLCAYTLSSCSGLLMCSCYSRLSLQYVYLLASRTDHAEGVAVTCCHVCTATLWLPLAVAELMACAGMPQSSSSRKLQLGHTSMPHGTTVTGADCPRLPDLSYHLCIKEEGAVAAMQAQLQRPSSLTPQPRRQVVIGWQACECVEHAILGLTGCSSLRCH